MVGPVLIRGVGDVGSAIAHALHRAGVAAAIHDVPCPATHRRGMAFADAMYDGRAVLDGVAAQRVDDAAGITAAWAAGHVPVICTAFAAVQEAIDWAILVDARMRKRVVPEDQRGLAPLAIGLGPGFVAGENTHLAIETSWDCLGKVVRWGPTLALAGEPNPIEGIGRERLVYAPADGVFRTLHNLGDLVDAGEAVALLDAAPLRAPLGGAVRGLTRDGIRVIRGTKVIEIDPRGAQARVRGLGERPRRIAESVVKVVAGLSPDGPDVLGIERMLAR